MQLLAFYIGTERYAVNTLDIVEVAPLVTLNKIPLVEKAVAGLMNFRGMIIPVIDLCLLFENRDSRPMMSTRILVCKVWISEQQWRLLGFMVERATSVMRVNETDIHNSGLFVRDAPFLSGVLNDGKNVTQIIEPNKIVKHSLLQLLFDDPEDFAQTPALVPVNQNKA